MRAWQQAKNIYHFFQAWWWRLFYGWPDRHLKIYGVTGTNGKTTTCYILDGILVEVYGREKVGMLTTVAMRLGTEEITNATKMTTLPSRAVFRYLQQMCRQGVTHVVMEITSHALDQHRLAGLCLEGAIVLNISREHLDYHTTMEAYATAKARIVRYLKPNAPLVVKSDDEWITKIVIPLLSKERGGEVKVIEFTTTSASSIHTPLPGEVNKENALAASLLARAVGIPEDAIERGVARLDHVPGRMEWITMPGKPRVLIDYAVTPDALERLYRAVQEVATGKIYAVLGAAGQRDRGKRPAMARVVARYADVVVLTREDPWQESEEQIFSDLEQGLVGTHREWRRIIDRQEALAWVVRSAEPEDIIVATGKGAEQGMGIGSTIVPWHERRVIEELLTQK